MIRASATLAAAALMLSLPTAASAAPAAVAPSAVTVSAPAVASATSARPKGSYAVKVVSVTDGDTIRVRV